MKNLQFKDVFFKKKTKYNLKVVWYLPVAKHLEWFPYVSLLSHFAMRSMDYSICITRVQRRHSEAETALRRWILTSISFLYAGSTISFIYIWSLYFKICEWSAF